MNPALRKLIWLLARQAVEEAHADHAAAPGPGPQRRPRLLTVKKILPRTIAPRQHRAGA
ncbi:MAG: hypothetical protein KJ011_05210 [Burkholderiaceae bacterium]|nr:hypothetical protein [Burkholderiaceae bacterium]